MRTCSCSCNLRSFSVLFPSDRDSRWVFKLMMSSVTIPPSSVTHAFCTTELHLPAQNFDQPQQGDRRAIVHMITEGLRAAYITRKELQQRGQRLGPGPKTLFHSLTSSIAPLQLALHRSNAALPPANNIRDKWASVASALVRLSVLQLSHENRRDVRSELSPGSEVKLCATADPALRLPPR